MAAAPVVHYNHSMVLLSTSIAPMDIAAAAGLAVSVVGIVVAVVLWITGGAKLRRDVVVSDRDPDLKPMAPLRKLMATPESSDAAAAGIAASRWRGQLANSTGWNEGACEGAVAPHEPSLPGRDLPNPEVETRAIQRAEETSRPLLIGPAQESAPIETEIRERLGKLKSLHASGA